MQKWVAEVGVQSRQHSAETVMRCLLALVCFSIATSFTLIALADEKPREIKIELKAGPDGKLAEVSLDGQAIETLPDGKQSRFASLHEKIVEIVVDAQGKRRPGDYKAVLSADDRLPYEPVAAAIEAFSVRRRLADAVPEPLVSNFALIVGDPEDNTAAEIKLFTISKDPVAGRFAAVPKDPVVLQMDEAGMILFAAEDFATFTIVKRRLQTKRQLIKRTGGRPQDVVVLIRADKNSPAKYVREVVHTCRQLEFETFAFQTAAPTD